MDLIYKLLFYSHGPRYTKDISKFSGPNPGLMKILEKTVTVLEPISKTLALLLDMENGFLYMDGTILAEAYKKCQKIQQETYTIVNNRGAKLQGTLFKADVPTNKYVFMSHGYGMDSVSEFTRYIPEYHKLGVNCFVVDHFGCGLSEGDFVAFGAQEATDCIQWLNFMKETFGEDISIGLHGDSMGAATVCLMLGKEDLPANVKYCIADAPYSSFKDEARHIVSLLHLPEKVSDTLYEAINKGFKKRYGLDLEDTNAETAVAKATTPLLLIHGKRDIFVPFWCSEKLLAACGSADKDLQAFETASHCQSEFREKDRYWALVKEWIEKYL